MGVEDGRVLLRGLAIALLWLQCGVSSALARSLLSWGGVGRCGREPCVSNGNDIVMVAHSWPLNLKLRLEGPLLTYGGACPRGRTLWLSRRGRGIV